MWRNNNELHIFIVGSINSQLESANTFWDQRGVDNVHIVHNREDVVVQVKYMCTSKFILSFAAGGLEMHSLSSASPNNNKQLWSIYQDTEHESELTLLALLGPTFEIYSQTNWEKRLRTGSSSVGNSS